MQRYLSILFLVLIALLGAIVPARADHTPPLVVFASVDKTNVVAGDAFTVTLVIVSTSTEPLTPTIDLYTTPGLEPADAPQPGDAIVWNDHPLLVLARYRVLARAAGYLTITAVVRAGGNVAQASTQVRRVGTMQLYLPLMQSEAPVDVLPAPGSGVSVSAIGYAKPGGRRLGLHS